MLLCVNINHSLVCHCSLQHSTATLKAAEFTHGPFGVFHISPKLFFIIHYVFSNFQLLNYFIMQWTLTIIVLQYSSLTFCCLSIALHVCFFLHQGAVVLWMHL